MAFPTMTPVSVGCSLNHDARDALNTFLRDGETFPYAQELLRITMTETTAVSPAQQSSLVSCILSLTTSA